MRITRTKRPYFALSAIRGELLERKREIVGERDSFGILNTGYLLSIVKIKREERERKKKRERETRERERERD